MRKNKLQQIFINLQILLLTETKKDASYCKFSPQISATKSSFVKVSSLNVVPMPEGTSYETIEKVFPCQLSILKKIKSILIDQCLGTYLKLVKIALKKFPPKISKPPIIFERPQVEVKFKRDGLEPEKVQFATSESLNVELKASINKGKRSKK